MNIAIRYPLIFGVALVWAGCASEYEEAGGRPSSRPATLEEAGDEVDDPSPATAPAVEESRPVTAKPPEPSPPPRTAAQRGAGAAIKLSLGVALPQSLPTGTAMGLSVEYAFTEGQPLPSLSYVWVIEPAKGDPVRQPVQLGRSGTLQAFFTQLRPDHGPFSCHIEGSDGNRLSKSISLR